MEELFIFLILLGLGYGFGKYLENKHYRSIKEREAATIHKPVVTFQRLTEGRAAKDVSLAIGSVVVSVDYFKRFMAGFRLFFGGELGSYASLIDRARREAILRMKESCPNADLYLNCRLETSSISKGNKQQKIGSVEILAYSTAVTYAHEVHPEGSE